MRIVWPMPLFAAFLITAGAAVAEEAKSVPSGSNTQIDFFASVNPDCSPIGIPTVRLIDGPNKGVVTTDKGRDFLTFPRSNLRHVCNRRRVSGLKLFYKSEAAFFGTDHVRILIVSGSGTEREATYAIKVR